MIPRVLFVEDTAAQWLMMLLTLAAVVLVYLTFRETRQTLIDTRRIGEAQVRAYLTIQEPMLGFNRDFNAPVIQMAVKNTGQSPAKNIEIVFRFTFHPSVAYGANQMEREERIVRWWFDDVAGGEKVTCNPTTLSDVRMETEVLGNDLERLGGVHLLVAIYADDVFRKEITTYGNFNVGWSGEGESRFDLKRASDHSRVGFKERILDILRPYRLGGEKDGQG